MAGPRAARGLGLRVMGGVIGPTAATQQCISPAANARCHRGFGAPVLMSAWQQPARGLLPQPLHRGLHASRRASGIFDGIKDQWNQSKDDYMGKKEAEIFQDQIAFLVKREKYTLSDFYDGLKEGIDKAGINGWRKHMPGVKSNPAYEEMQMSIEILEAIPKELLDNPNKLKAEAKVKISKASGRSVTEINKIIGRYDEAKLLHGWLRKRVHMNKPLPTTMDDVMRMAMEPDSGFPKKMMMKR